MNDMSNFSHEKGHLSLGSLAIELSRRADEIDMIEDDDDEASSIEFDDDIGLSHKSHVFGKVEDDDEGSGDEDLMLAGMSSDDTDELCGLGDSLHDIMDSKLHGSGATQQSAHSRSNNNSQRFRRTALGKPVSKGGQTSFWTKRPGAVVDQSYNLRAAHESWVVYDAPHQPPTRFGMLQNMRQKSMVNIFLDNEDSARGSVCPDYGITDLSDHSISKPDRTGHCIWLLTTMAIIASVMILAPRISDAIGTSLTGDTVTLDPRLVALQSLVVDHYITEQEQLDRPNSPANQALLWIAQDDPAELEIPGLIDGYIEDFDAEHALFQRYSLAVFYFSVHEDVGVENEDAGRRALQHSPSEKKANQVEFENNWLTVSHICQWHGILCDEDSESVTAIELPNHLLQGTLPRELFANGLPFLRLLNLANNELRGSIPTVQNSVLQELDLTSNHLSGSLDGIMEMTELVTVDVQSNLLEGTIPEEIQNLSALQTLSLSGNNLSGSVPAIMGNLIHLGVLDVDRNNFSSSIPSSIGQLTLLKRLLLDGNTFEGQVPEEVCSLTDGKLVMIESDCKTGDIRCDCCTVCL